MGARHLSASAPDHVPMEARGYLVFEGGDERWIGDEILNVDPVVGPVAPLACARRGRLNHRPNLTSI